MRSHLDIFGEVPARFSGGGVHLVRWGFMPRPQERGKSWRFEFGNYKDTGGNHSDQNERPKINSQEREHLGVTLMQKIRMSKTLAVERRQVGNKAVCIAEQDGDGRQTIGLVIRRPLVDKHLLYKFHEAALWG